MTVMGVRSKDDTRTVLHWYDFICPFCYVSQNRNSILARHGFDVVELPFQSHPEIPPGGILAGPRDRSWITLALAPPPPQYASGSRGCRVGAPPSSVRISEIAQLSL